MYHVELGIYSDELLQKHLCIGKMNKRINTNPPVHSSSNSSEYTISKVNHFHLFPIFTFA